jgi:hypothetical protein
MGPAVTRSKRRQLHSAQLNKRNVVACHHPRAQLQDNKHNNGCRKRQLPSGAPNVDHQTRISPDPELFQMTGPRAPDSNGWNNTEMEEKQTQLF